MTNLSNYLCQCSSWTSCHVTGNGRSQLLGSVESSFSNQESIFNWSIGQAHYDSPFKMQEYLDVISEVDFNFAFPRRMPQEKHSRLKSRLKAIPHSCYVCSLLSPFNLRQGSLLRGLISLPTLCSTSSSPGQLPTSQFTSGFARLISSRRAVFD